MTGHGESDSSIQLHFCQRCGISIPEVDIETSRAKAAPGGYVCVGCIYQARDDELAPQAPLPHVARPVQPASSSGVRALAAVAMLYVVGVTSFLLVRELNRKEPDIKLPAVATARDIVDLSRKVDLVDDQTRKVFSELRSNDDDQQAAIGKLGAAVAQVQRRTEEHGALVKAQHKDLVRSIVEIADRTVGMDRRAKEMLSKLNGLEQKASTPNDPPPPTEDKDATKKADPEPTVKVDPERKLLVDKFIKQMLDKGVDRKIRFNAAMQLGDLMDPSSVDAFVMALQKDSYDLVRRAAAYSLGMLGKHAVKAVPALIAQMDDKEPYVGYTCERALGDITKIVLGEAQSFGFDPTMDSKKRREIQGKWQAWWEKNKARVG